MPADDSLCGVIDCDGLDSYFVTGPASPTGTNYRKLNDYDDLTQERCQSLGACKAPNSTACQTFVTKTIDTCAVCKRATLTGCAAYGDYTSCAGTFGSCDARCFGGSCAWRLYLHNDGSVTCGTLCAFDGANCRGARTDAGQTVGCNTQGEYMWCYCTGTPNC